MIIHCQFKTVFQNQNYALSTKLNAAYFDAYKKLMEQAASFSWEQLVRYEDLILDAEKELFETEVRANKANEDDDSERYTNLLHDAYRKEL